MSEEIRETEQFLKAFAMSTIMYDPLDRPLGDQGEQGTTNAELMETILNMKGTAGKLFKIPLSNSLYTMITKMIDNESEKCLAIANAML